VGRSRRVGRRVHRGGLGDRVRTPDGAWVRISEAPVTDGFNVPASTGAVSGRSQRAIVSTGATSITSSVCDDRRRSDLCVQSRRRVHNGKSRLFIRSCVLADTCLKPFPRCPLATTDRTRVTEPSTTRRLLPRSRHGRRRTSSSTFPRTRSGAPRLRRPERRLGSISLMRYRDFPRKRLRTSTTKSRGGRRLGTAAGKLTPVTYR